jgi:hypothetical protein
MLPRPGPDTLQGHRPVMADQPGPRAQRAHDARERGRFHEDVILRGKMDEAKVASSGASSSSIDAGTTRATLLGRSLGPSSRTSSTHTRTLVSA